MDTTFVTKQTTITRDWAQDVNDAVYKETPPSNIVKPIHVYSRGIVSDGTDQTTAMVALMTALGTAGYRGFVYIPYGTAFNMTTVYAAVPTGVVLLDESSVNLGHSPGGIQKYRITYSGDIASDDFTDIIASPHHPARMYLNLRSAGTTSAAGAFMSEVYGIAVNSDNDILTTLIRQHKKDESSNKWIWSYRVQTPYSVAVKNPQPWAATTAYATGDYCTSDGGKVYLATAGGTSGSTAITGTGTSISDGSVTWSYKFPALNIDSTFREEDEMGNVHQYGVASLGSSVEKRLTFGARSGALGVSLAAGVQLSGMQSFPWQSVTGATPTLSGSYGYVENASATNMTAINLPTDQVHAYVELFFGDGNTTLKHNTSYLRLKGGVDVTPAAGSIMSFVRFNSHSSAFVERHRSF